MKLQEKLDPILHRYEELNAKLADSSNLDGKELVALSKEHSSLSSVVEKIQAYQSSLSEIEDLKSMLEDPEMKDMAHSELIDLQKRIPEMEKDIQIALIPKDEADEKNAILEVRAGTGGDEAALFAAELFHMYQNFARTQGWKFEVMEISETGIGGFKEATANISGTDVFAKLKYESGVHRVQRVPKTESGGRVHTSAATVAVLPEAEDVDIHIEDKDLRIDTYRASGPGGQCVNT
ncbi:MAG: PCRF domain-containing protein, partial [Alphaproteobacteria bacterium]|nr:PCRF domain-containing protein [Alphaproteobacteria bacterium]